MSDDYTIVGRVRKPHGIRGELIVEAICDAPDVIFAPGRRVFASTAADVPATDATNPLDVIRSRPFKQDWLVGFRGITDRNGAELWRERYLFAPASELTEPRDGEVWLHELAGMRVENVHGAPVGDVRAVHQVPQGFLIDVATARGVVSIPYVDAIVVRVDRAARTITIDPPAGLLEL